jgi:hypothetical protein
MAEESRGEYYLLDLNKWEPVKQVRGVDKGNNPIISSNGSVHVDKNRIGEDVRVFVRKQSEKKE